MFVLRYANSENIFLLLKTAAMRKIQTALNCYANFPHLLIKQTFY